MVKNIRGKKVMSKLRTLLLSLFSAFIVSTAMAQSEYLVRSGDTLIIEVLEDPQLNRSAIVLSDGRISFPLAGTVRVAGRNVAQIEASIQSAIASNFTTTPNVFVAVQPAPIIPTVPQPVQPVVVPVIEIFFIGEVNSPGMVEVAPGTRFLQGIARSGGLTRFAADKRVQLRRTDPLTGRTSSFVINYGAILDGAVIQNNIVLEEGDVIVVPERRIFE
jgi:polysaccharide export outer membrane protein